MLYAQISNNIVLNIIELDDISLIPIFSEGFDHCIPIGDPVSIPSIGWNYIPYNNTFISPNTAIIKTDIDQGNYIILQFSQFNSSLGINVAGQTSAFLTYSANLFTYLSFGYLLDAIAEINTMIADTSDTKTNLSPFVDNDNLIDYKYQIQNWLKIPNE